MRYVPDYDGLGDVLRSPEMYAALEEAAHRVIQAAQGIAPVGEPPDDPHPGRYRDSFETERALTTGTWRYGGARAKVRVVANVPYAARVELKHKVLSRAMDIAKE